jgi:hypothetical protein
MAAYLGKDKIKVFIKDTQLKINLYPSTPVMHGVILLSADGYILKDLNGVYITAKKEDGNNG